MANMDKRSTAATERSAAARVKKHAYIHAIIIFVAFFVYILMVCFNALSTYNVTGLFISAGMRNLSEKYITDITPAGLTFSIWGIIYIWQAVWLLYAVISIFRMGAEGPLYRSPILLPPVFFIIYIANNVLNTTWLFLWDRERLVASFVILLFVALTLFICIAISMRYLTRNLEVLTKNRLGKERWWIWIGVQNGLAIYATWATVAAALNLAVVLEYRSGLDRDGAGTVALIIILACFIFWAFLELVLLDRYARYLFMPYITVAWAFGGILVHHWGVDWTPSDRNAIVSAIGIAIIVGLTIVKIVLLIYRQVKTPLNK